MAPARLTVLAWPCPPGSLPRARVWSPTTPPGCQQACTGRPAGMPVLASRLPEGPAGSQAQGWRGLKKITATPAATIAAPSQS
jgi:hypothetical protein